MSDPFYKEAMIHKEMAFGVQLPELIVSSKKRKRIYAVMPITTGKAEFDAFLKFNVTSREELETVAPGYYKEKVFATNMTNGLLLGQRLADNLSDCEIIVPAKLFKKGWEQDHYNEFWEHFIVKYADGICIQPDYPFSKSGFREVLLGIKHRKEFGIGEHYAPIDWDEELSRMEEAIRYMKNTGADVTLQIKVFNSIKTALELSKPMVQ